MGESLTGGRALGFLLVPHLVTSGRETSTVYMGSWVLREEKLEMKDPFVLLGTTGRFGQTRVACSRTGEQGWTTLQSSARQSENVEFPGQSGRRGGEATGWGKEA